MARDDDGARPGRHALDHLVLFPQALALVGRPQLVGQVVVADRAEVDRRALWQDVLGASRRVLGRPAGDVDRVQLLDLVVAAFVSSCVQGKGQTHMGMCLASARIASLGWRPYFFSSSSPSRTCMSSSAAGCQLRRTCQPRGPTVADAEERHVCGGG